MATTPDSFSSGEYTDLRFKTVFFSNEYPSDDLKDLFRRLHRHAKDRRFPVLARFLDECLFALRDEISKLPASLQDLVPSFDSVLSLATRKEYKHGPLGAAMESALLTILELGLLIGHYERESIPYDLKKSNTVLSGLSIGILAGAAVAVADTFSDLPLAGAESARVSFRLGVYVDNFSRLLEAREGDAQSWAYVVTGLTANEVKEEVAKYNERTSNPSVTRVFISAADKNSVSVSGPPTRLKDAFRSSERLRYSKYLALPVYDGLCHASHIYDVEDINTVMHGSESRHPGSWAVRLHLISSNTGKPFPAKTAAQLYEQIGAELLTGTIFLDNVTDGILDFISNSAAPECQVSLFRTSIVSKGLLAAIEGELPHVIITREDYVDWSSKEFDTRCPRNTASSKLAVVGMSCRMPGGADDSELFWQLMVDKKSTCTKIPKDRFDIETHYDPTGYTENATQVDTGNFVNDPGLFDSGFFNMSPREAEQTDPMARLALVTAYEALEMAGYAPNRTPSTRLKRVGTWYGQASDDWRELNGSQNISTYAVPGGERAFANGRINYFFKFAGPSYNIDTACSSGLAAVQTACSALWAGEVDTAIAGGLNIITDPDNYAGLGNAHFLSKTGQCKVWDESADGYCRADGVGSVVIKRLEDAEADNDNIIATVLSGATNHSAEAVSITHPHAGAQRDNYNQVMDSAGISPLDVSYVELHGTGTQAGDAVESESVGDIFAPTNPCRRVDRPLYLGAVKSNIGHGEAAAGIASFLKVLLVYRKNSIPPHVGIVTRLNPTISKDLLGKRGAHLVMEQTPWLPPQQQKQKQKRKRFALVNSFGAHGGNSTMLLEDAPPKKVDYDDPRSAYPITISARGKQSLKGQVENLITYLNENPSTSLGDLSYTLCARRFHHNSRLSTAVTDIAQLRKWLEKAREEAGSVRSVPVNTPPVVFTFTGQGAFYQGMAAGLYKDIPAFAAEVHKLGKIVTGLGFPSILPVLAEDGGANVAFDPLVTQLATVVIEIALIRFWATFGIKPSTVIGHSLGEYTALYAASVLSAANTILLVGRRAQSMMKNCTQGSHVMLSIRAQTDLTPELIGESCGGNDGYEISCINGTNHVVVSGQRKNLEAAQKSFEAAGFQCNWVDVPFAFHTAQVDPILDDFEAMASHISFKQPQVPYLSPLLKRCIFDSKTLNANYLRRACREPVDFVGALRAAEEDGITTKSSVWLEIGPHPVCSMFVKNILPDARPIASLRRKESSWLTFSNALACLYREGVPVNFNEYFRPYERAHTLLELPRYAWNNKNYWIPYHGTWTLDKAFAKDGGVQKALGLGALPALCSSLKTSLIHQVTCEQVHSTGAELTVVSDMTHPEFRAALEGHMMNGFGVATSSIWGDIMLTLAEYLHEQTDPKAKSKGFIPEVHSFECFHGQVAQKDKKKSQLLQIESSLDLGLKSIRFEFFNLDNDGVRAAEPFARGAATLGQDPAIWKRAFDRQAHLITGRMSSLKQMAAQGEANAMSRGMAYTLFKNVVDYADKYRGMQSVVLHEYEASADIILAKERDGIWHTPPHWIDSVSHLAGLVMNGSDASNTRDFFYVTPGFGSWKMLERLEGGARYSAYVKMLPSPDDAAIHAGDVYIMREDRVIGVVEEMKFRKVPRMLMDKFFSPPDAKGKSAGSSQPASAAAMPVAKPTPQPIAVQRPQHSAIVEQNALTVRSNDTHIAHVSSPAVTEAVKEAVNASNPGSVATTTTVTETTVTAQSQDTNEGPMAGILELISTETGLEVDELTDDRAFAEIGVDSLMSLVLSEKMRNEVQVDVKSSVFIECPTVGALRSWMAQHG